MSALTHTRLLELCFYDAATGELVRRVPRRGIARAGAPMGGRHRANGYGRVYIDGCFYLTHRVVWFYVHGRWPLGEIDHINGVRDDNRIENMRDVDSLTNTQNQRAPYSRREGQLLGAYVRASGKWVAQIGVSYRRIHLGYFDTAEEAHAAYVAAKRKLHAGCTI